MALWVNGEILFVKVYASPFCSEGGNRSKALQRSQRGRQFCEVDSGEVQFLLSKGLSKSKIAEILGVSHQTCLLHSSVRAGTTFVIWFK